MLFKFFPEMILASMTWLSNLITVSLVLLHKPSDWSKFCFNIIVTPIFNLIKLFICNVKWLILWYNFFLLKRIIIKNRGSIVYAAMFLDSQFIVPFIYSFFGVIIIIGIHNSSSIFFNKEKTLIGCVGLHDRVPYNHFIHWIW